ncbi:MAG: hypothetical protein RLZZ95_174 [Pseudomonadota bacterium]|jgi:hypothetical protein
MLRDASLRLSSAVRAQRCQEFNPHLVRNQKSVVLPKAI